MNCVSQRYWSRALIGMYVVVQAGCATWLPTQNEPAPVVRDLVPVVKPRDAVGIETILVRLDEVQAQRLDEVWAQVDEQALTPELRIALDKNGMRAGKVASTLPALLEEWVRQTVQRVEESPLEQAGVAADVTSYSQLWRCRANSRKELTIRRVNTGSACVFYHQEGTTKGHTFDTPHFLYAIHAAPVGDAAASVRLTPELEHGDPVKKVSTGDGTIRPVTKRESIVWDPLAIDLRINKGDCIVIGPSHDSRGLGEHYFHTITNEGAVQPVLLIVRLSESNQDEPFALPSAMVRTK
jgi:hypothetical protein